MGEDYEAMQNFKLFADGKPIATAIDAVVDFNAEENDKSAWGFYDNESHQFEWGVTIDNEKLTEDLRGLFEKPSRKFTRGERKLFIRTVEHHGSVEFTLHDWKGMIEGVYVPHIILVCNTPRQVRLLLRMKNLGKVSYKIRKKYDRGSNKRDCRNAAHD